MEKNSSVIIIGAGLSGLSVAAFLSRMGVRVKLLERLDKCGGFVHTFKRGKYLFEASTHQMAGCGMPVYGRKMFEKLGIDNLPLVKSSSLCEVVAFNRTTGAIEDRYLLPTGYAAIHDVLRGYFPENTNEVKKALNMFYRCGRKACMLKAIGRDPQKVSLDALFALMLNKGKGIVREIGKLRYRPVVRFANTRFIDAINFVGNERLRWLLGVYSCYLATDPEHLNAFVMNMLNYLYMEDAPYLVKGGSSVLIHELEKRISGNGGKIYTNCTVKQILVSAGTATGVVTGDGKIFTADTVISAINTNDTFGTMIPSDQLPDEYVRKVTGVVPTSSVYQIYLGLKRDPREFGFNASTTFFDSTRDISERYSMQMKATTPQGRADTSFIFSNYTEPGDIPSAEKTVRVCIAEGMMMGDWGTLSPEAYEKKKKLTTDTILSKVEKITGMPVRELADVVVSGTPRTMRHYSGIPSGAFAGAAYTSDQILSKRTQPETPVKNLYLAGPFTSFGGVMGSIDAGITTGNLVLKHL
ncbi:MAG: NAD(P)/FAD-dependent oxidoreductase [Chitinispirillaceae bacterium]|nr:NAD(P)/FAD-dependent oxidoreductase [Chitinispirillaceae bacterium]